MSEIVFVIFLNGLEPMRNDGKIRVFTTYEAACEALQGHELEWLSVIAPITAERLEELKGVNE